MKYSVQLNVGGKTYEGKGKSVYDALTKIKPFDVKAIGKIEITKDGKLTKIPLVWRPIKLKRLFANDWELQVVAKRLETLV